jgi:site-specific recombinase XerD
MSEQPKLLDQLRNTLRRKHYSKRTEKAYIDWNKRFILFHNKKHPREMGAAEVEQFLTYLAVEQNVAASTQNQALNAIVFLYKEVLRTELGQLHMEHAKKPEKLPVVFSRKEVRAVMAHLDGIHWLMTQLLYGAGLRLMECVRLRVKDVDFDYRQILVRDGKGAKDQEQTSGED